MSAKEELEATQFAIELLMPVDFVKDYVAKHKISLDEEKGINDMAKHFKVPIAVMAGRLWSLKLEGKI